MSNHARRSRRHSTVTKTVGASGTILTLGAALVAATPGTAGAATIQVTSATDDGSGGLTLREAIEQANGTPAADVITFAPALNGQTITLAGNDIPVTEPLAVQGPGADLLEVNGADNDRIFYIDSGAGAFTVSGLTLADGATGSDGGAIYSETTGAVTITNVDFIGSYAEGDGGAVSIEAAASVSITGSFFYANESDEDGGAVHIYDVDGAITVTGNTFDSNVADNYGGGLALYSNDGPATITGTFTNNEATLGGGISVYYNSGSVSITATVTDNYATYGGGVDVYNSDGAVTISQSTIADNDVSEAGGGLRAKSSASVTIDRSTLSGNYASFEGAGAYAYGTDLTFVNTTISGNDSSGDGGGLSFTSGEAGAVLDISHSTITDNDAGDGGGGMALDSDATIDHTIVAANGNGSDIAPNGPGEVTLSNSILGQAGLTGALTLVDGGNNELGVVDPGLGALADNGGPTFTHALLDGSPALNAGDPGFAAPPSTDQRGQARVSDGVIDKGAYEAQVAEPPPTPPPPPGTVPPGATPVPANPTFTG